MQFNTSRIQNVLLLTTTLIWMACTSFSAVDAQDTDTASSSSEAVAPMGPFNPANWKIPSFKMPEMKMPSLKAILPQAEEKQRIAKKKDNFFSEIGKTASSSWSRTKEAFNPNKLNPTRFFTVSSRTPSKAAKESKPGFFSSLFSPGQEDRQTASTTDFLKQDRPQP